MSWVDGPMLAFDTETTGVNVETDRILSASLVHINRNDPPYVATEWINPGVPIPATATAIHGITDTFIKQKGQDPAETLEALCLVVAAVLQEGTPIVGMNVTYDLTIFDRECRRHGVLPLSSRVPVRPAIDVMVLDKKVDPYRKGSGMRKLTAICPLYKVPLDGAHSSEADAMAAARVAWRMGRLYPPLGELTAQQLHDLQVQWKVEQDASFARWAKSQKKEISDCDGSWPYRPHPDDIPVPSGELEEVPLF